MDSFAVAPPSFTAVHGLAHVGYRPTLKAVSDRFVWFNMKKDLKLWCQGCQDCQASKVSRHVRAPLEHLPPPDDRFEHIHVDLVGPLPSSEGQTYLFTIIDRFARWPEAIPLPDASTVTCARALLRGWVSRFGCPVTITSDRGPQFTSALWAGLSESLGMNHVKTTAYHPQANGMVERFHRTLKAGLMASANSEGAAQWMDRLPLVLLGLRTAWRDTYSPAQLLFGCDLRLPGQLPRHQPPSVPLEEFIKKLRETMRSIKSPEPTWKREQAVSLPPALASCQYVFLRRGPRQPPLSRPYDGPYLVLSRSAKTFTLKIGAKEYVTSIDRVKPAFGWLKAANSAPRAASVPATVPAKVPVPITSPFPPVVPVLGETSAGLNPAAPHFVTRTGRAVKAPVKLNL